MRAPRLKATAAGATAPAGGCAIVLQRSETFGRLFRLQRRRARLSLWRYTLQSRAAR
jgi:hypothetical protein